MLFQGGSKNSVFWTLTSRIYSFVKRTKKPIEKFQNVSLSVHWDHLFPIYSDQNDKNEKTADT